MDSAGNYTGLRAVGSSEPESSGAVAQRASRLSPMTSMDSRQAKLPPARRTIIRPRAPKLTYMQKRVMHAEAALSFVVLER